MNVCREKAGLVHRVHDCLSAAARKIRPIIAYTTASAIMALATSGYQPDQPLKNEKPKVYTSANQQSKMQQQGYTLQPTPQPKEEPKQPTQKPNQTPQLALLLTQAPGIKSLQAQAPDYKPAQALQPTTQGTQSTIAQKTIGPQDTTTFFRGALSASAYFDKHTESFGGNGSVDVSLGKYLGLNAGFNSSSVTQDFPNLDVNGFAARAFGGPYGKLDLGNIIAVAGVRPGYETGTITLDSGNAETKLKTDSPFINFVGGIVEDVRDNNPDVNDAFSHRARLFGQLTTYLNTDLVQTSITGTLPLGNDWFITAGYSNITGNDDELKRNDHAGELGIGYRLADWCQFTVSGLVQDLRLELLGAKAHETRNGGLARLEARVLDDDTNTLDVNAFIGAWDDKEYFGGFGLTWRFGSQARKK